MARYAGSARCSRISLSVGLQSVEAEVGQPGCQSDASSVSESKVGGCRSRLWATSALDSNMNWNIYKTLTNI